MRKVILPFLGLLITLSACQMKSDSIDEKGPLAAGSQFPANGLVHAVYFDVVDSLSADELATFAAQLKRLEQINGVQARDFAAGPMNLSDALDTPAQYRTDAGIGGMEIMEPEDVPEAR